MATTRRRITDDDRAVVRPPTAMRVFTRWTTDDLEIAEALTMGGSLWRAADLCWALLGDSRVWAAAETRVKGLLSLPLSWDESGDGRSSGRVARALEDGDFWAAHSEAALFALALWGIILGVGLAQRVWMEAPSGRLVGVLKPYDLRYLRWDKFRRVWVVKTELGDVDIVPGERRWVLYAPSCSGEPDGDERPWMYGAWRRCGRPWLLKYLGLGDFGHHSEVHGSPIRTADYDAAAAGTTATAVSKTGGGTSGSSGSVVADLGDKLANTGGDSTIIPPRGWRIRFVEATANTWKMFPAEVDLAAREIVIAITGQASSTEIQQGQETGATLHGTVRGDLIRADALTLSTCLHDRCLADYAELNFGSRDLAPWPRWKTDPPANIAARGNAMKALGDGIVSLDRVAPEGKRVDRAAIFEEAGIALEKIPAGAVTTHAATQPAQNIPPGAPAQSEAP